MITSWQVDTGGHWYKIFDIWDGGLGIRGGVAAGVPVGLLAAPPPRSPSPEQSADGGSISTRLSAATSLVLTSPGASTVADR